MQHQRRSQGVLVLVAAAMLLMHQYPTFIGIPKCSRSVVVPLRRASADEQYSGGTTPLMLAAHEGDIAKLEKLVGSGAKLNDQDDYGWTALRYAVRAGHKPAVDALIGAGADLDLPSSTGRTPLMSAAGNNLEEMTVTLISAGADIMAHNKDGKTAWDMAMRGGPTGNEKIRELVSGGQYHLEEDYEKNYDHEA